MERAFSDVNREVYYLKRNSCNMITVKMGEEYVIYLLWWNVVLLQGVKKRWAGIDGDRFMS